MEKETFLADHVKSYVLKKEVEIAADNWWVTHPTHLNINKKIIVAQCQ